MNVPYSGSVSCPLCRDVSVIPAAGAVALPLDPAIGELIASVRQRAKLRRAQRLLQVSL